MTYELILLLIGLHYGIAQNLFAPNIFYTDVYVSSAQSGSLPEYVVDTDFFEDQPTCFASDIAQPDTDGFHWILIDFGVQIGNIKEIRLTVQPSEQIVSFHSQPLEAFIVTYMDISKDQLNSSNLPKTSLPWNSPYFNPCTEMEHGSGTNQVVTLQCPIAYSGRWLAIRRRAQLNICLVNVYIERAFDECFEVQQSIIGRRYTGSVFRYIRHTPKKSCRSLCMQAINCEATLFTKQRLSGICQLIAGFHIHDADHQGNGVQELSDELDCPQDKCIIEMNYCHGGTVQQLEQRLRQTEENGTSTALYEEEWLVKKSDLIRHTPSSDLVYVLSVLFHGRIECEIWDCGLIYVAVVDRNQSEHFCGTIDTIQVSRLDKAILFCNSTNPILNPLSVRVRWYGKNVDPDRPSPQLQFHIHGGNIRTSRTRPVPKTTLLTTTTPSSHPIRITSSILDSFTLTNIERYAMNSVTTSDEDFSQFVPSGPVSENVSDHLPWTNELETREIQPLEFNVALNDQEAQREVKNPNTQSNKVNEKMIGTPNRSTVGRSHKNRMHEKQDTLIQASSPQLTSQSAINSRLASHVPVAICLFMLICLGY